VLVVVAADAELSKPAQVTTALPTATALALILCLRRSGESAAAGSTVTPGADGRR
jgi:hypothetical protein